MRPLPGPCLGTTAAPTCLRARPQIFDAARVLRVDDGLGVILELPLDGSDPCRGAWVLMATRACTLMPCSRLLLDPPQPLVGLPVIKGEPEPPMQGHRLEHIRPCLACTLPCKPARSGCCCPCPLSAFQVACCCCDAMPCHAMHCACSRQRTQVRFNPKKVHKRLRGGSISAAALCPGSWDLADQMATKLGICP